MIQKYVNRFMDARTTTEAWIRTANIDSYGDLVKKVMEIIYDPNEYDCPDPERVTAVDYGDYQGTLVFVIGGRMYQPYDHWYVRISYGSCSGCDTLEAIRGYGEEITDQMVQDYWTLMLHIVQRMKLMDDNDN